MLFNMLLQILATDPQTWRSPKGKKGGFRQREAERLAPKLNVVTAAGPHDRDPPLEEVSKERNSPGGPNYTEGKNYYRPETTELYPYYRIRDIQPLEDR